MKALYICYLPFEEPLVETQVLAYLRGLAQAGHEMHLLTFELRRVSSSEASEIAKRLGAQGVTWHHGRYHKWPSLPATVWDVIAGSVRILRIAHRYGIEVLHARNHVPGMMALLVRKFCRTKLIFDIRGVMAQEYIDGGIWKPGSLPVRITEWTQRRCIASASGIVVLTKRARSLLFGGAEGASGAEVFVIPSCADVETITAQRIGRETVRDSLGFADNRVLIYLGKFSTWYMAAEMAGFFAVAARENADLRFLIVTQSDPRPITKEFTRLGVSSDLLQVTRCRPDEVGAYLGAADLGISFIKAAPSKVASSPTKIGEYLAAGIPIVTNPGVGDVDSLLAENSVGVLVAGFEDDDFRAATTAALDLTSDPETSKRCIDVATNELSLSRVGWVRYKELYEKVAGN